MATQFKIEVLADKVEARIKNLQAKSANTKPVFETIGRVLKNRIRLGFQAGRSPWGIPWAPLKTRMGQPLIDTSRLRSSITSRVGNGFVEVGTNLKYARTHQFGATIKPKTAPRLVFKVGNRLVFAKQVTISARPFMPVDAAGNINLPPAWSQGILKELGNYFGLGAS